MIRKVQGIQGVFRSKSPSAVDGSTVESTGPASRSTGEVRPHARVLLALGLAVGLTALTVLLVASSSVVPAAAAADACPNAEFRTGKSAHLANCRAYEQVSPVDKNGGNVTITAWSGPPGLAKPYQVWKAAAQGGAVAYVSQTAFSGSVSSLPLNPYLGERDADGDGWDTRGIGAPMNASNQNSTNLLTLNSLYYSDDLSHGVLRHLAPTGPLLAPEAILGYPNLYVRDFEADTATAITTVTPPGFPPQLVLANYKIEYQGASDDYSHVIFRAPDKLTPDAPSACFTSGGGDGCLYESTAGQLRLVSVLPDGSPAARASGGGRGGLGSRDLDNAISNDGSKIYWTEGPATSASGPIYVRVDGTTTVPVGSGRFRMATPDGSRALYGSTAGINAHLLLFDLSSGASTDLNPSGPANLVGASDDLSYVYFTDGAGDLYLHHDGTNRLIANEVISSGIGKPLNSVDPTNRSSYVTPDGRHLAFVSNSSPTGYNNTPLDPDDCQENGVPVDCAQVFHYDADSDQLSCASCKPSGARPEGRSFIQTHYDAVTQPRVLSDDGGRVFFNSSDNIVPGDSNGQQDVYEWQPEGSGGCGEAGGCVSLISGGTDGAADPDADFPVITYFVDASADGDDVFFTTQERLVPGDPSGDADLYDARVGGGLASQHAAPRPPCSGDECQGEATNPPEADGVGSVGQSAGNPTRSARGCQAERRSVTKLARKAKRVSRKAANASGKKARRLTRKARQAKKKSKRAKRELRLCRRAR